MTWTYHLLLALRFWGALACFVGALIGIWRHRDERPGGRWLLDSVVLSIAVALAVAVVHP